MQSSLQWKRSSFMMLFIVSFTDEAINQYKIILEILQNGIMQHTEH